MAEVRRALAVLLAAVLVGCTSFEPQTTPSRTDLGGARVERPLRLEGHLPLVEVMVDGEGPFPFILDTGSAVTVLSESLARRLDLERHAVPMQLVGAEAAEDRVVDFCRLREMKIGTARFAELDACVLDLDEIARTLSIDLGGLLNAELFRGLLVTIDYDGERLLLERGRLPAPDGRTHLELGLREGTPALRAGLGDRALLFTLDTGSGEVLALPDALLDELDFSHGPVDGPLSTTVTGRFRDRLGRLADDIVLGAHRIERPIVALTSAADARLGGGLLSEFEVTIDLEGGVVRLTREEPGPIRRASLRSSGLSFERGDRGWRIFDVIPGSGAARADLRVGDEVTAVAGLAVERVTGAVWGRLVTMLDVIAVEIDRDGRRLRRSLPIVELVP